MPLMPPMQPAVVTHTPPTEASRWVRDWSHLVDAGGAVLDIAAGNGRHARWFASRGHPVLAVDRDAEALARLAQSAQSAQSAGGAAIATRDADLENAPWPLAADQTFAAVVVTNYLHRPMFPQLIAALAPGGVLIYETFAVGNARYGKPSNPAFLLEAGELLAAVQGKLRVIAYQDGWTDTPRPSCVQRICAVRERSCAPDLPQTRLTDRNEAANPPRYDLPG